MQSQFSRRCFSTATFLLLLAPLLLAATAQSRQKTKGRPGSRAIVQPMIDERATVVYTRDDSFFPNPERGFYVSYQPLGGGLVGQQDTPHRPLVAAELRALRQRPEAITLIRDNILIPRKFWTQPISQQYLDELQSNFDAVRAAGLKTVPRLLYDWGMQNRDADENVINRHLEQLAPLFQRNADVIAWMQGGLFGGAGEGNASDHGYVFPKYQPPRSAMKWQGLSDAGRRLLAKELQMLPPQRMMTVRYPRFKWDLFGWDSQSAMTRVLAPSPFDGNAASRVGFYNDGFMGSPEHYAMFQLPNEANFTSQDSTFVVHEGEISDASDYKLQDNQVTRDMTRYHMTSLNCGGDAWNVVSAAWKKNNDYDEVARRLGYRFRLTQANLPRSLRPGAAFIMDMAMANDGFARALNPRAMEVVLRNTQSGAQYRAAAQSEIDNRLWLPAPGEVKTLQVVMGIPVDMPPGDYEVLLNLPDPQRALYTRPEYSLRLANQQVWEAATGFNRLLHTLRIDAAGGGTNYVGPNNFAAR